MNQEIPKTNDRDPKKSLYIYSLNPSSLFGSFSEQYIKSWINLKEKLQFESSKVDNLRERIDRHGGSMSRDFFTQAEIKEWNQFQRISERLEHALLKMEELILLFTN
jgi:hypothetical protein